MTIKMRKFPVFLVVILLFLNTVNLWIASKSSLDIIWETPLRSASQILALLGIILMSLTIVLSAKIRLVDKILNGLDKAYNIHRIAGSAAFILLLNHPLLLVVQALPQAKLALTYLFPSSSFAYNLGIFGIYLMVLAFVCMFFIRLPYDIWKLTHKLLGPAFLLGGIHALLIGSDVSNFLPLRIWIGFFIAIGAISAIYSLFLFRRLGQKFFYRIARIERSTDVVTIYLKPQGAKTISYFPGQFVYVEFKNKKVGSQLHPFSIASSNREESMEICVKIAGDYSLKLFHFLQEGDEGVVYGPYGQFTKNFEKFGNCLWIAGGIGVTPFLSMLSAEAEKHSDRPVYFYYTYSKKEEGVFLGQIYNLLTKASNVTFFDWCTKEKSRLTVEVIGNYLDVHTLDGIFLCGPSFMMEEFKKQFVDSGIPEQKIFYENFSFIS